MQRALITNKYKTGNVPSSFVKCVVCFLPKRCYALGGLVFCPNVVGIHCLLCFLPTLRYNALCGLFPAHTHFVAMHCFLLLLFPPTSLLCIVFFGSCPRFVAVHWFVFCPHFVAMHCVVVVFLPPTSLLCIVWFGSCPRIVAVHCVVCFLPKRRWYAWCGRFDWFKHRKH